MKSWYIVFAQLLLSVAVTLMAAYPASLLWNYCLVNAINGLVPVGWIQMFGIIVLFRLVFDTKVSFDK